IDLFWRRHRGAVQGQGAGVGRELSQLRDRRLLRGHDLPSRGERLRRAGGRVYADDGREGHAATDSERSHEWAAKPPRDGGYGAYAEPAERDVTVLLQRLQQSGPRSPGVLA